MVLSPVDAFHVIAIMGSPNVGKSTLFNRLLGKRRAITDPTPGVTRDPVDEIINLNGTCVRLVDTGGFKQENDQDLDDIIRMRSMEIAEKADIILLVLDAGNIDADDEELIKKLRPFSGKIILVVNKIDTAGKEDQIWNFYKLGFDNLVGISSSHGRNIGELKERIRECLNKYQDNKGSSVNRGKYSKADNIIRLSILGKPNTGKSTLANKLIGEEKSITSDIPGTTRDVIRAEFEYRRILFQVMDTAGIRRKNKVRDSVEYYSVNRAIKSIKESDIVLLLIDSLDDISDQDKKIAQLVVREGKGIIIVLNKWDILEKITSRLEAIKERVKYFFPVLNFAPVINISALKGQGINNLLNLCIRVYRQLNIQIKTPALNTSLKKWIEEHPVPSRGKNIKIRYGTQISSNPVHMVFFVNKLSIFPKEYSKYLINKIRMDFGVEQIPIRIDFREKA